MLKNRHHPLAGHVTLRRRQPVFVDRTGRRRRLAIFVGLGIGAGLLASLALIIAGLVGGSATPSPGWPATGSQRHDDNAVADLGRRAPPNGPPPIAASPEAAAGPRPSLTSPRPGQGDEHRRTDPGKPSRSPGKPH
jgi:hypothetical protein